MIGGHGGNIYQLARRLNCEPSDICDMSANVNPLGPMPELVEHLREHLSAMASLPEVDAGTMVEAFADYHGIDPATVTAGNGTTQLIYRIPRALGAQKALVMGPTYADYQDACAMHGVACEHLICQETDDFHHRHGCRLPVGGFSRSGLFVQSQQPHRCDGRQRSDCRLVPRPARNGVRR